MVESSIFRQINRLSPRNKILYLSTVGISFALIVFGICVWALSGRYDSSSKLTSSSFGEIAYQSRDETTDTTHSVVPVYPTKPPSFERKDYQGESFPTPLELVPSIALGPSPSREHNSPGLRATMIPSSNLTAVLSTPDPSRGPTQNPSEYPSRSPSSAPTSHPRFSPSTSPIDMPSMGPSASPLMFVPTLLPVSLPPKSSSSPTMTAAPTSEPTFQTHDLPANPDPTYFNYNTDSKYGPSSWENVTVLNSTENYWREFGFLENRCNTGAQSPIDLCDKPVRYCVEEHEFRTRSGDYTIQGDSMIKEILPNKLRVVMARRQGEEPDPPSSDFSGVGYKAIDMSNIDIKFPSEHTLCGRIYDGEMQYYFYHPVRKVLIAIAWLFEAQEGNATNNHMQLLIDEFQQIYDENEDGCLVNETAQDVMLNQTRSLNELENASTKYIPMERNLGRADRRVQKRAKPWDPFHTDIQKTVHFWGYSGSLTEPPCTDSVLWRVMDVPVKISLEQLHQMQNILFNNRNNNTCAFTSTHFKGGVARPITDTLRYYKCTRRDYVSDSERALCGDAGCEVPFGKDLEPYVEPEIFVTGPPSLAPTLSPSN
ncbi:hypothetical protein HJC23_005631 [Cyclotella cryptica]|uniref:carbonic anhydrase n=1 Tax=Cyclotella cryptica TaxID=29204 RepID=A0ABD3PZH9_9STRA|eukprot:CCRYP_010494-RB/>CCRYP_010494-RB protein AED:0.25 eAED:0.25 QI:437/1/1/1/1/1/2/2217/596